MRSLSTKLGRWDRTILHKEDTMKETEEEEM